MKLFHFQILLSTFMVILPISLSQFLEHRLWKNYGQVIYDYSGNNHHGWNGRSVRSDIADCIFTDRGAYISPACRVSMHDFILTNPISIFIWAISDGTASSGRLLCRFSPQRKLQVFRDNIYSGAISIFKGPSGYENNINGDPNLWYPSN